MISITAVAIGFVGMIVLLFLGLHWRPRCS